MKISLWKVLLFVLIIIAGTILLFPGKKNLVPYYVRAGAGPEARTIINELLAKNPGDPRLLLLSADAYEAEGKPDQALAEMHKGLKSNPDNPAFNLRLAKLYDAARDPEQAARAWEKVHQLDAKNLQAAARLINLYRYRGETIKEALSIVKLIQMEAASQEKPANKSILDEMITAQILNFRPGRLSTEQKASQKAAIVSNLYEEKTAYRQNVEEGLDNRNTRESLIFSCLEILVAGGGLTEARQFAAATDKTLGLGSFSRLQLVDILSYYDEGGFALTVARQLTDDYPEDAELWRLAGELALDQKNYAVAIDCYQQALKLTPNDADAREKLALSLLGRGDVVRALALYQEIEENKPGADKARALQPAVMRLMQGAQETGNVRIIQRVQALALAKLPNDPDVLLMSGDLYLAEGKTNFAYQAYRRLAMTKASRSVVEKMLEVASFTNRQDYILEAAGIARRLFPRDTQLLCRVAEIYVAQNNLPAATATYRNCLALKKNDPQISLRLATLYEWMNNPQSAWQLLQPLAAKQNADKALLMRAAELALACGQGNDAYNLYVRLYRLWPQDQDIRQKLATLAAQTGRPLVAARYLAEISDEDRHNYQKAIDAGEAYSWANRPAQAIAYFERARSLADNPDLKRKLAQYYSWTGMRRKQIAMLKNLEQSGNLNREESSTLAEHALEKNDARRALGLIGKFQTEQNLSSREGVILARAHALKGDERKAAAIFRRLARANSRNAKTLADLGDAALWSKQTDAALEFYEASLRIDPDNPAALKGSAQIYAWNNDTGRAIAAFEKHNSIQSADISARYQLGELYHVQNRAGEAATEYQKTLKLIRAARAVKINKEANP